MQMLMRSPWRPQQQEDEIHRLIVDSIVCDVALQAGEQPEEAADPGNARMRQRHAAAHTGRAQRLALFECLQDG